LLGHFLFHVLCELFWYEKKSGHQKKLGEKAKERVRVEETKVIPVAVVTTTVWVSPPDLLL